MIAAAALALQLLNAAADRNGVPRALLIALCAQDDTDPEQLAQALRRTAEPLLKKYREDPHALDSWHEAVLLLHDDFQYAARAWQTLRDGLPGVLTPQETTPPWPNVPGLAEAANYSRGRELPVEVLVIHDMEGFYWQTQRHFAEPSTAASAHFSISGAGELVQHVPVGDTAWHAANWDLNSQSIGIEHEGFADQPFPDALYRASAALTRYLSDRFHIPQDRLHLIGHYEVPDPHHPGWFGGAAHHSDPCDAWQGESPGVPTWHNNTACRWDWDRWLKLVTHAPEEPAR